MADFDYPVVDGDSTGRKIRAENLGTDDQGIQILGHKFWNDTIGAIADVAATNESGSSTVIALLKGALRELVAIAAGSGGGGSANYLEGRTDDLDPAGPVSIGTAETTLVEIDCRGYKRLGIIIENAGGVALNSFVTKVRYHSSFTFHFPEVAGSYDTGSSNNTGNATVLIRKTNGTAPESLASGEYTWIRLNVEAIESIEFTATVGAGTTDLNAWWILEN
ncbi:hypothetical protein U2F10_03050 [Leptothoe sp. EHU-05/26/07-4]